MDCQEIAANDIVEEYVLGRLAAEQRDAFEAHYFECQSCFERVEACLALQRGLAEPQAARAKAPARARRPRVWLWPAAVAAAAAASLVMIALAHHASAPSLRPTAGAPADQSGDRTESLRALGGFTPPPYAPSAWRGASTQAEQRLDAGLTRYAAGDYAAAAVALREAVSGLPESSRGHFYLGISLLRTGHVADGLASLERVIRLGDTPYLESAHFYLAKALLSKGDARAARAHLESVVALRGDLAPTARGLLQQIERVQRGTS